MGIFSKKKEEKVLSEQELDVNISSIEDEVDEKASDKWERIASKIHIIVNKEI